MHLTAKSDWMPEKLKKQGRNWAKWEACQHTRIALSVLDSVVSSCFLTLFYMTALSLVTSRRPILLDLMAWFDLICCSSDFLRHDAPVISLRAGACLQQSDLSPPHFTHCRNKKPGNITHWLHQLFSNHEFCPVAMEPNHPDPQISSAGGPAGAAA